MCSDTTPEGNVPTPSRRSLADRLLSLPVGLVVSLYLVIDGVVLPIFKPLSHWLERLSLVRWIEHGVAALPPYAVLLMLAVPFVVAEPAKLVALYWMATGRFSLGLATLIAAYVLSLLVMERIYHAGRDKLLTIRWFAVGLGWTLRLRDSVVAWLRDTEVWQAATLAGKRIREALQPHLAKWRSWGGSGGRCG